MKKAVTLITAAILCIICCSCSEKKSSEEIFEGFRDSALTNDTENEYYIRISETSAGVHTLKEASKTGNDCAFMESCTDGSTRFFRKGKYIVSSAETFYVKKETKAEWTDFGYDSIAVRYDKVYNELLKTDSFTVEKKKSDDEEAPYKITAKYDIDSLDTKALFSNSGNYGSVTITFLTDKSGELYKNITLNCQYDYNSTIYIYSVQFGAPNEPDSEGNNGQRPIDIKKIFESNTQTAEST
ncbi:MAG: hypothetical protein ACI4I9_09480 [Porcipelethomonas sp.]